MTHQQFSLGVLANFGPPAWQAATGRLHGGDWWTGEYFITLAQRLEAAGVDFLFFLDTLAVRRDADGDIDAAALASTVAAPSHDPLPLLAAIAAATKKIGLIGTASTSFYPPYTLARVLSTLDSMSGGRIGWNVVNSFERSEAKNFGFDDLIDHGDRYERAEEYVELARKLWAAWDDDALVQNEATNTYVDASRVHSVDHEGQYFRVQGPLNVLPSPQRFPVIAQAGASERGLAFAAKNAELAFVLGGDGDSLDGAIEARTQLRTRAAEFGRDPDSVKAVFPVNVVFLDREWDPAEGIPATDFQVEAAASWLSQSLDIDLLRYPMDEPFPLDVPPSGIRSMFSAFRALAEEGMPLRQAIVKTRYGGTGSTNFFGTPEQVAQQMISFMDVVGGDAMMLSATMQFTAADLDAITERLVPALRAAGVLRGDSVPEGATFRERLSGSAS
ncbi:MAG TPA: NtaA/DmoA family FMN-dependent monooxygenase [Pseudolysinimonas sp.]|nr:NtaA/DmoA family FMN-dependent monooxygenase [Pseudolysinimonas sp.]